MKTVNSLSGGKTSSYIAANYPADINIFSLVRIDSCLWMNGKDEKTRQIVSDKIGREFIGTAEMDEIVYTILDLEQYIGKEITWVSGDTFETVIDNAGGYLPNQMNRFCTTKMKIEPIFDYLKNLEILPVEMRIGFRPNEYKRAERVMQRANSEGLELMKTIVGTRKTRNKWGEIPYRIVKFPLIEDNISKDIIYDFWNDKPIRFAYRNNCVGCVNRQPLMISHMASKDKRKIEWFSEQEKRTNNRFLKEVTFESILNFASQGNLFLDDDFNECDSGFCGI
jgi:hypothetical protein